MPVRFTCRLLVDRTEEGKIRLRYGPLDDMRRGASLLIVNGPRILLPPQEEFTLAEYDAWLFQTCSAGGFSQEMSACSLDAALVEAKRTYEDEIPKGSVSWSFDWIAKRGDDRPSLAVIVVNQSKHPIPCFSVATAFAHEALQPLPGAPAGVLEAGGSETLVPLTLPKDADLPPRLPAVFVLPPDFMKSLASRSVALSTESHWIELRTDGREFDRIPGAAVAGFLETEPGS